MRPLAQRRHHPAAGLFPTNDNQTLKHPLHSIPAEHLLMAQGNLPNHLHPASNLAGFNLMRQTDTPKSRLQREISSTDVMKSPGSVSDGRVDNNTADNPSAEQQQHHRKTADPEMVEIEIEGDLSDNDETDDNEHNTSRDDDDPSCLNKSSCGERKKKTRTVFSRGQIGHLEAVFDDKRYLSSTERSNLARALHMTETQVKIWFQNRRNKWKRMVQQELDAANASQLSGHRLMQLPYIYSHEELNRGVRGSSLSLPSLPPSTHPVVPPTVHHYYGGMLRAHTS